MEGRRDGGGGSVSACITPQPSVPVAAWQLEHIHLRQVAQLDKLGGNTATR